jgi:deoxyhypusine synthase
MTRKMRTPPVVDYDLSTMGTVQDLVEQMGKAGGFTAAKVYEAASILREMMADRDCFNFLSFPACIISTGTRGIIKEMVKRKWFDCIITTTGMLDHDLARTWRKYHRGSFEMDDVELHHQDIHRLGNILIPMESYGIILEKKMQALMKDIWKGGRTEFSTREIVQEVGKRLDDESSITYWAAKNDIPIYIPGPFDGAFGSQLWMWRQTHPEFKLDLFKDEQELADIVFDAKRTGALMVGGGISKHHVIWWNQYRDGLDYAVYITTAVEWDGSLSGARTREAISWGKLKERAPHITLEGDATVLLPIIASYLDKQLE